MIYGATFKGVYPVGASAMIRAQNKKEAAKLLQTKLEEMGLPQTVTEGDMITFKRGTCVVVLTDGDY